MISFPRNILVCIAVGLMISSGQLWAGPLKPIDFGALLPLTGPAAEQGEMVKRGFDLAVEVLRKDSIAAVQINYQDTSGNATNAVNAFRNLLLRKPFPLVFSWGSGVALALMPLADKQGVIQMGIATATPDYRKVGDFNFRLYPSAEQEGKALAEVALRLVPHDVIVVGAIENDYGLSMAKVFEASLAAHGRSVAAREVLPVDAVDFKTQLLRLKTKNPDIIFLASYAGIAKTFMKQARELQIGSRFILSAAAIEVRTGFAQLAGEAAEGLVTVVPSGGFLSSNSPEVGRFVETYAELYHETPDASHAMAARTYDAVMIAAQAALKCNDLVAACLSAELLRIKEYHGASGIIGFDEAGDSSFTFEAQALEQGKFVSLERRGAPGAFETGSDTSRR